MKLATYNVNGIVGRLPQLLAWLAREVPDVVCLQELKAADQGFPAAALRAAGYHAVWHGQRAWNGVAILARDAEPVVRRRGLPGDPDDTHSRYIEAEIDDLVVASIYLPNGNPQPGPKFDYKLAWFERLIRHARRLIAGRAPVVLAGDFNVVPTDEDIYNPRSWRKDALLQPESRAAYRRLLAQGWTDALRAHDPAGRVYTYWDYFRNHWARDAGLRIDHLLLSPALAPRLEDAGVDRWVRGEPHASDHAPTWVRLAPVARRRPARGVRAPSRRAALVRSRPAVTTRPSGRAQPIPAFVPPQLATLAAAAPVGGDWRYEIKYDGYRLLARVAGGRVRLFTRSGKDWTARLPHIARAVATLALRQAWLDGEIVVYDKLGVPSFQALQNAFEAGSDANVAYFVFDLLYLDGRDLRGQPLTERKRRLAQTLGDAQGPVRYSDDLAGDIEGALAQACRLGLEGLIAKRADAPYASGRTKSWLKLKCRPRQEFVVGGYTAPGGTRQGFGSLLLGYHDDGGRLRYAGRVGTGFDDATLSRLARRLGALEQRNSPFAHDLRPADRRGVRWVRPALVAEVEFTGWTDERLLRQASFVALRSDKAPRAVTREPAEPAPRSAAVAAPAGLVRVADVTISHPQRPIWPAEGIDKAALARYYERVGPWILPHLKCRPLSLVRCPDGAAAQCFFQRHMGPARVEGVKTFVWERSQAGKSYLFVATAAAVIQLVQQGVVELHTWGSLVPRPGRPDRITFDLDPDPELPWARVAEAARLVRALVEELGLQAFLKTTGGKGLHVVVPIERRQGWDEVKAFARSVAAYLARAMPDRFTATVAKRERVGRIFVDYLRNGEGATAVAAYSARARPGAPVSMPIGWDELAEDVRGSRFSVINVPDLLAKRRRDPWEDYAGAAVRLTAAMRRAL